MTELLVTGLVIFLCVLGGVAIIASLAGFGVFDVFFSRNSRPAAVKMDLREVNSKDHLLALAFQNQNHRSGDAE